MSLTQIARFADLTEAQIAASRLRADGFSVLVQNEHWGAANFMMSTAMGGFPCGRRPARPRRRGGWSRIFAAASL